MINLLPYKEKKSIERVRMIRIVQTIVLGIAVLIGISGILLLPTIFTINSRFSIASKQIETLENTGTIASQVDLSTLEKRAREAQGYLATVEKTQITEYINLIKSLTPSTILINRFTSDNPSIVESYGSAESREVLQAFITTLENNEKVALVDSPVSNFIKNKNGSFKLTISFKQDE